METLRIGHPPRLSARARLRWHGRQAWLMLLVCVAVVVLPLALLMVAGEIAR